MAEPEEMGSDITFEHMLPPLEEPSEVQKFYDGTHVFITGGTGFLGNLLIQKLIRSCPEICKIYVLIRSKNGKTSEDRLDDMFKDPVFERMILEQENFYDKIQIIDGDCEKANLGISEESRKLLSEQVHVVFHLAATRFEDKIKKATTINVSATKDMIALAQTMQNLKAFVYVSTVYSHCPQTEIDEQFYDVPISAEKILQITNSLDDNQLRTVTSQCKIVTRREVAEGYNTPRDKIHFTHVVHILFYPRLAFIFHYRLLEKWPNTYTFTKAIAEDLIKEKGQGLPITVVRPSMVVSTCKDPLSGWTNNYYGPVGMVMAASLGLMRSFQAVPEHKTDMVPADYVVNSVIVAAWQIGKEFRNDTNNELVNHMAFHGLKVKDNIPIFNYVCSPENSITWGEFMTLVETNGFKFPALLVIWYYCFTLNPNYYVHKLYTIFLHHIPAYIIDIVLFLIGKKPMMVNAYKKLHYFQNFFTYFSLRQWIFKNNNTQALWKKLNTTDQRLFCFNMKDLYWNEYCFTFIRGARVYLLKESMDTLPQAKKRYRIMKLIHYALVTIFCYICWRFINLFW